MGYLARRQLDCARQTLNCLGALIARGYRRKARAVYRVGIRPVFLVALAVCVRERVRPRPLACQRVRTVNDRRVARRQGVAAVVFHRWRCRHRRRAQALYRVAARCCRDREVFSLYRVSEVPLLLVALAVRIFVGVYHIPFTGGYVISAHEHSRQRVAARVGHNRHLARHCVRSLHQCWTADSLHAVRRYCEILNINIYILRSFVIIAATVGHPISSDNRFITCSGYVGITARHRQVGII